MVASTEFSLAQQKDAVTVPWMAKVKVKWMDTELAR
jgi:hypothetical protein